MLKHQHIKIVKARGKKYYYFRTNRLDDNGRPILARLPDPDAPNFWAVYGSYKAGRNRRAETILTVSELIAAYLRSPKFSKLSDGSQRIYRIYLSKLQAALPTAPAGEIERKDIARLADGLSEFPAAANMLVRVTAALYKWGRSSGHVNNEPTKDIELNEGGAHEPWPEPLLNAALASEDELIRTSVGLLYYTAQRIGDVCRLRWDDIPGGHLSTTQKKTSKLVEFPIHADLRAILAQTPKRGMTIIAQPNGRPYKPATVRAHLQQWAKGHGYDVVPHGLRKNAVIALLEADCNLVETAAISGQSLEMVQHYAKARDNKRLGGAAILKWEAKKR